jgi:hypothetical protein
MGVRYVLEGSVRRSFDSRIGQAPQTIKANALQLLIGREASPVLEVSFRRSYGFCSKPFERRRRRRHEDVVEWGIRAWRRWRLAAQACQVTAAASKRTTPNATKASPGQFDFIPKPLPGLRGSKVSLAGGERSRLPLNWPLQSGWAAKNSTPRITSSAPIHMRTTVTSSRASSSSWHCFRARQEPFTSARPSRLLPVRVRTASGWRGLPPCRAGNLACFDQGPAPKKRTRVKSV